MRAVEEGELNLAKVGTNSHGPIWSVRLGSLEIGRVFRSDMTYIDKRNRASSGTYWAADDRHGRGLYRRDGSPIRTRREAVRIVQLNNTYP